MGGSASSATKPTDGKVQAQVIRSVVPEPAPDELPFGVYTYMWRGTLRFLHMHLPQGEKTDEGRVRFLDGVDLRPTTMKNNLRGNLFPDQQQRIQNELRTTLALSAFRQVDDVERRHRASCPDAALVNVTLLKSGGVWSRAIERVFGKGVAQLVAEERWEVNRCGKLRPYRVSYFIDGDAFYPAVVPLHPRGWMDWAVNGLVGNPEPVFDKPPPRSGEGNE